MGCEWGGAIDTDYVSMQVGPRPGIHAHYLSIFSEKTLGTYVCMYGDGLLVSRLGRLRSGVRDRGRLLVSVRRLLGRDGHGFLDDGLHSEGERDGWLLPEARKGLRTTSAYFCTCSNLTSTQTIYLSRAAVPLPSTETIYLC